MQDKEQAARIALLQLHTSQMQGHRTNILSATVIILVILEIWFRIPPADRTFPPKLLMSMILSFIIFAIAYTTVRQLWHGRLVRSTASAPYTGSYRDKPLIYCLDQDIANYARDKAEKEVDKEMNFALKWAIRRGDPRNFNETLVGCIIIWFLLVISLVIFGPYFNL